MTRSADRGTTTDADSADTIDETRRHFLGVTATLGGVALAGCSGSNGGMTETPMQTEEAETDTPTATEEPLDPDVPVLNYALTLEHLENAFYRDGLAEFSDDELQNADVLSAFSETVRMQVPDYLATIGAHEKAHVDSLSQTVSNLGGDPVGEADYDFGYETPSEFLGVAKALENTGVAAYAGAAPWVQSNDILAVAAGVHSVEARHASFLNLVNDTSSFPKAVDEAKTMDEVLSIAGQFVTSNVDLTNYENDPERPAPARKGDDGTSDVEILNYALTLEHLENAFYRAGLAEFSDDELQTASVLGQYGSEITSKVPGHLATVGAHEKAHVDSLTQTVSDLGGDPVSEATYDFGYDTPSEFLGVAKALENTGVAAYAGVAGSVSNDDIFDAAIGIHSVEARHASFLNELNVTSPFPKGVDQAKTMDEVTDIASQFIVEG